MRRKEEAMNFSKKGGGHMNLAWMFSAVMQTYLSLNGCHVVQTAGLHEDQLIISCHVHHDSMVISSRASEETKQQLHQT